MTTKLGRMLSYGRRFSTQTFKSSPTSCTYEMRCAIWYHLNNFKNVKNTHGGVLLLLKVTLLQGFFSRIWNCANGIKSQKASHILVILNCSCNFYLWVSLNKPTTKSCGFFKYVWPFSGHQVLKVLAQWKLKTNLK